MLKVLSPGLLTTIQDLGRPGFGRFGISPGGPLDSFAFRIANRLAGNSDGAAALEITAIGPQIEFQGRMVFALAGANLSPELSGTPIETWRSYLVEAGDVLTFGARLQGSRVYAAVSGGLIVPRVFGSAATDLEGRFGGIGGSPLRAGQVLFSNPSRSIGGQIASLSCRRLYAHPYDLRFVPAAQWPEAVEILVTSRFTVSRRSSRMGYRLEGPAPRPQESDTGISEPIAPGSIQAPAGSPPILLMSGRQTVGGYPCLGHVISADAPKAAQLWFQQPVRFHPVDMEEARRLFRHKENLLAGCLYTAT